jgi:hypothetical protein
MAGTLVANTINTDTGLFSTQNAYSGIVKAWVNFTYISGTLTVTSSFNLSSLTRSGTGQYTFTFATAMPNANYGVVGAGGPVSGLGASCNPHQNYNSTNGGYIAPTTTAFDIGVVNEQATAQIDPYTMCVAVFSL